MDVSESVKLVRLSDTNLTLEHAAEDVRGCKVTDVADQDIGHVDDLMIDEDHKKVRFLVVAAGGFLGIGEKKFWLPVDAVTGVNDEQVFVDTTVEHVKSAPVYDPEIVASHPYASDVYAYYGVAPYWGSGYIYPPYPFMMGGPGNMI
jgi:sporulation protein YlmC with PRC-barrel domain